MTRLDIERTELQAFTASVQHDTARSLDLLRNIESTLAWLDRLTKQAEADAEFAEKANLALGKLTGVMDPDGSLQANLEEAQEEVHALYTLLIEKRKAGREDRQLTEEDGIEGAYTAAISAVADLHNAINTMRWNIGEHDIDAAPHTTDPGLVASTPEEVEAAFRKLMGG